MSAWEKFFWSELIISLVATALVLATIPWLGPLRATGSFGLLGLVGVTSLVLLRKRGNRVVMDERDQEISRGAVQFGLHAAWLVLFFTLLLVTQSSAGAAFLPLSKEFITILLWFDFAVATAAQGLAGVILYRRQRQAA